MKVAIAFTPASGVALEWEVDVAPTASAIDAIRASGISERCPEFDLSVATIGVWGLAVALDAPLKEGDRVEIYRPLAMDPNEARRLRARQLRQAKRA